MQQPTDEATGLPPLSEVIAEDSLLAVTYQLGQEGLVQVPDEEAPVPVLYLSVRGLVQQVGAQGDLHPTAEWAQMHVAFPRPLPPPLTNQLDSDVVRRVESVTHFYDAVEYDHAEASGPEPDYEQAYRDMRQAVGL